jgi:hypothetical protein
MTAIPSLPGGVLRVGVTGARSLDAAQLPRLSAQLADLLRTLAAAAARAAGAPPRLQLLSSLAEGADRLAAEVALAEGFALVCPLPFAPADYEQDFATPASLAAFRALLARAGGRVLALDGGRGDDEAASYEAVGRLLVRNCDLMIGIWNGRPGQGRGGTDDTIHYAACFGRPVIWLHATDPEAAPRWIETAHDLRHGAEPRAVGPLLGIYLARLLHAPAPPAHSGHHSLLHRLGHWMRTLNGGARRRLPRRPPDCALAAFLRERPYRVWGPWRLHRWLMRFASGRDAPWTPPHPPDDALAGHWFSHYQPADERAGEYAARYRSGYVWVFALAALALAAAAAALALPALPALRAAAAAVEFASLALILVLVLADGLAHWRLRAVEYRLLAELCRKQQVLAPLAWVVPRASAWATSEADPPPEADAPPGDHGAWVAWLFSAWLREASLPAGTLDGARVEAARAAALRDLIEDQIDYHTARRAQCYRASRRLVLAGEGLFLVLLVLVAAELWLLCDGSGRPGWLVFLGLAGAILPALSAALVGIRASAELEPLAERSDAMLKAMRAAQGRIQQLDCAAPLASQALGNALAPVTALLLEDLEGWARLFRAKVVEA